MANLNTLFDGAVAFKRNYTVAQTGCFGLFCHQSPVGDYGQSDNLRQTLFRLSIKWGFF